jgi:hypothetical protein
MTACDWCPRFFFNTSAPGATSVTVRHGCACCRIRRCMPSRASLRLQQDCIFMPQSGTTRATAGWLLRLLLALTLFVQAC